MLYCPTFRDRARRLETPYDLPMDLEQMRRALGDDVHLLLRTHYLDSYKLSARFAPFATDVSRHHDVTELMLLADVLVTDYSSVMFDFANTGKPMVFFTYDYEDYVRDERGTYIDLPDVAPGPVVMTTDELIAALREGRRRRRGLRGALRRLPGAVLRVRDRARRRARRQGVLRGSVARRAGRLVTRDVFLVANNVEELGGVQRVTHNLATMLHERGHRVTVVGIQHAVQPHDYGDRPYRWLVLNEEPEPPMPKAAGLRGRLDPRVRAARDAHQAARKAAVGRLSALFAEADDGVVVCMQVWSMSWVAAAKTGHLHVIGMSHESFDATLGSTRWERVQQLYRDVDLLLLLTEHDASRFELEGFNNVGRHAQLALVLPRGGQRPHREGGRRRRPARVREGLRPVDRRLRVGRRPAPGLGPEDLRRGSAAGPAGEAGRVPGLAGRVLLPGLAGDIETELVASSVFALSSIHEGLPMALAEGMACGLACVAFDCAPGVREIVTDGVDGIVVPPRNVPALAEGLSRLMADEDLRRAYGSAARQSVRRFAPDAVLAGWERLFDLVDR